MSQAWVGVDDHDLSVPGVVLLRGDGEVLYRQVARDKTDRPTTGELLAEIDRALGLSGRGMRGGYAPLDRLQLGLGLGAAVSEGVSGSARLSLSLPLGRHLLVGPSAGGDTGGRLDLDGVLALRLPFYADLADVSVAAVGGRSFGDVEGWHAGGRLAVGFAWTPSWGTSLVAGAMAVDGGVEVSLLLELTRLVRIR